MVRLNLWYANKKTMIKRFVIANIQRKRPRSRTRFRSRRESKVP